MTKAQKALAQKILERLDTQRFADWYNKGAFDDYVTGAYPKEDLRHTTKDDILKDIVDLFKL